MTIIILYVSILNGLGDEKMTKLLTNYEIHELKRLKNQFNHTFETIMFVENLNNNIIKYYRDCVYDYLLRQRLEKLHGRKISDGKYKELIQNDYKGLMLFPSVGTGLNDSDYIKERMNELRLFYKNIKFNIVEYSNIIDFLTKGKIGSFLTYEKCVDAARELKQFDENKFYEYIIKTKKDIARPDFGFIFQLHDFIDRLNNYYLLNNNIEQSSKLSRIKRDIKALD